MKKFCKIVKNTEIKMLCYIVVIYDPEKGCENILNRSDV